MEDTETFFQNRFDAMHSYIDLVKNVENLDEYETEEIKGALFQILNDIFEDATKNAYQYKELREELIDIMNGVKEDPYSINDYYYFIMIQFFAREITVPENEIDFYSKNPSEIIIIPKNFEPLCVLAISEDLNFFDINDLSSNPFSNASFFNQKKRINKILNDQSTGYFMKYYLLYIFYLFLTQRETYWPKDFIKKREIIDFFLQIDYAIHSSLESYLELVPENYFEKAREQLSDYYIMMGYDDENYPDDTTVNQYAVVLYGLEFIINYDKEYRIGS